MKLILYRICLFISIFSLIYSGILLWQRYNPWRLSFEPIPLHTPAAVQRQSSLKPVHITISSVNIDAAITPARITNQQWETSTQGASWLLNSPVPGDLGNSIIYGHNWYTIFGKLVRVKPGDIITVNYSDKSSKQFVVQTTAIVPPNQVSILYPTNDIRITLYTCTGFLDSHRFVATAIIESK